MVILIFGIDKYKVQLAELKARFEIMDKVVRSGNKIPFWYVEDRDELVAKIAKLEKVLELKEKKSIKNIEGIDK
jgi:hypothetical protein